MCFMENLSLYNLLVGYFDSEGKDVMHHDLSDFEKMSEEKKLRRSIIENLKLILQTRQGSVLHLPEFGIPDVLQVYFDSDNSIDPIKKQIRETILKYEPRIGDVKITKSEFDQDNMRISFKILATIKENQNKEVLLTEFSSTGWTKVVFERDME